MAKITSLDDFDLYQVSLEYAVKIFKLCKHSDFSREYALVDQVKRASMSIPANLAEGYSRRSRKELYHFVSISHGSANELMTYLHLIEKIFDAVNVLDLKVELDVISRRCNSLKKSLTI